MQAEGKNMKLHVLYSFSHQECIHVSLFTLKWPFFDVFRLGTSIAHHCVTACEGLSVTMTTASGALRFYRHMTLKSNEQMGVCFGPQIGECGLAYTSLKQISPLPLAKRL